MKRSDKIIRTQQIKLARLRGTSLVRELPIIEVRLREAGLYKTAMLMRKVVQASGYELDELLTRRPTQ